jgi:hypothetical protein
LDKLEVKEFSLDSVKIVYFNNTDSFYGGPSQVFSIQLKK